MANVTTIYACTEDGLAIFNKPGTLNEWLPPRRVLAGQPVRSAWAEAGPPVRVVAVQNGEILVSENGGRAWEKVDTERPAVALFPGKADRRIYATLEGSGLLCSNDGGTSWSGLASLPGEATQLVRAGGVFYLSAAGSLYTGEPDSGKWQLIQEDNISANGYDGGSRRVYAATGEGIVQSEDAGKTWTMLPGSPSGVAALEVVPGAAGKPPALVAGNRDGIYVSQDGGESWQQKDVGGQVTALARDPERRDRLYAGTATGYIYESGNRGQAWSQVNSAPLSPVIAIFIVRI